MTVAVQRLRARDARGDAVAARLRTERALAQVQLRPRALPPAAILLVRGLRARITEAPAAFDALARTAARPARGVVPAAAQAVLFASRAELLACLASDACSGVVGTRWWWRLLDVVEPQRVVDEWETTPEHVPAAFAALAASGEASVFAARIPTERAIRLVHAVARVHGVAPAAVPSVPSADARIPRAPFLPGAAAAAAPVPEAAAEPPHHDVVPEARAAELLPPQRALLRLALTLHRAPALLRRPSSVFAAPRMSHEKAASVAPPAVDAPAEAVEQAVPPPFAARPRAVGVVDRAPPQPAEPVTPRPEPRAPAGHDEPSPAAPEVPRARAQSPRAPGAPPATSPSAPRTDAPAPGPRAALPPRPEPDAPAQEPEAVAFVPAPVPLPPLVAQADATTPEASPGRAREWTHPLETAIGGVFFVLCVAQRLGLYADFTEPAAPGLALDPWRFVSLVGRSLLDVDDPLWELLDELARDEDEPDPPHEEIAAHTAAVRAWLEEHVDLPPAAVVDRHALVYVDDVRVDAVFALVDHPIEIRIAGLDIDPGWIPAAGRALYFHFE